MPLLVKGVEQTVRELLKVSPKVLQAYRAAVRLEAERIMAKSQEQVPVKTGNLKNSKFIVQDDRPDGTAVLLGYRADYAVPVHEAPPTTSFTVGKPKFLEDPLKAAVSGFDRRVAETTAQIAGLK